MPTDPAPKHVLVARATGRFGIIVDALLARGHAVRAPTRDPGSPAASRLRAAGAEVLYGDFDDPDSYARAAAGVDSLFATGTAHQAGPTGEPRHGTTSPRRPWRPARPTSSTSRATARPRTARYRAVRHQAPDRAAHPGAADRAHDPPPVYFMENLFNPWNLPVLHAGVFPSPIPIEIPLHQVALADVAGLATIAIERPDQFAGQRIAVASDGLTAEQASRALSRVVGRHLSAEQIPAAGPSPGLRALFDWLAHTGHAIDLAALRHRLAEVGWHDYNAWLVSQRARLSTPTARRSTSPARCRPARSRPAAPSPPRRQGGSPPASSGPAPRRTTNEDTRAGHAAIAVAGALHPDLVAQLHSPLNADLDPFRIAARSGVRLGWPCPACGDDWLATPRTASEVAGARNAGAPGWPRPSPRGSASCPRSDRWPCEDRISRASCIRPATATLTRSTLACYSNRRLWWRRGQCAPSGRPAPATGLKARAAPPMPAVRERAHRTRPGSRG